MYRLRTLVFGALALFATAILTTMPAAAFDRDHRVDIVIAMTDHGLPSFDLVLPAAAIAEHAAILKRAAEAPIIEVLAAAPDLGPVYQLSLRTDALSLVDYHRRC